MIFQSVKIQKQKNSPTDKHLISVFYLYIYLKRSALSAYTKQAFYKYSNVLLFTCVSFYCRIMDCYYPNMQVLGDKFCISHYPRDFTYRHKGKFDLRLRL